MTTVTADTKTLESPLPERAATRALAKPNVRSRRAYLILTAIIVATLGGYGVFSLATRGTVSTDDAQVEADVVPLGARVGGPVVVVHVAENQSVKKGDVLLEIDDAEYAAKEKEAEADLAQAQAQAERGESEEQIVAATAKGGKSSAQASVWGSSVNVQSADAQMAAAQASLSRAEVEAKAADTDLARAKGLHATGAIPQAQLDAAQA